ncbi:hypothetical protein SADUNF_Sadunf13G0104000 [Salix dunnii]|uniref:Uncharacterized protein n=1 Tax=Salix dunnii TaxID=1413687 RepID=A0A835MLA1_9ROSI|nr:hypothetical protein SADUNF_Sadunf13G0104000 [Salix dunnii]
MLLPGGVVMMADGHKVGVGEKILRNFPPVLSLFLDAGLHELGEGRNFLALSMEFSPAEKSRLNMSIFEYRKFS